MKTNANTNAALLAATAMGSIFGISALIGPEQLRAEDYYGGTCCETSSECAVAGQICKIPAGWLHYNSNKSGYCMAS
jgi:hypothetical protein